MADITLAGKRVVISGASAGIGRACALHFLSAGANVLAIGLQQAELDRLTADTAPLGGSVETAEGDVTDKEFVSRIFSLSGDVDVFLNVAGVLRHTPFLDGDPDHWGRVFDVNVVALLRLTQGMAMGMVSRGAGHIMLMSSALARAVYPYTMVYAASKHAVHAISAGLRQELGPKGIRVTEVCPGLVGGTDILNETTHPAVVESFRLRPYTPIQPDDVARAVVFAASAPAGVDVSLIEVKPVGQP